MFILSGWEGYDSWLIKHLVPEGHEENKGTVIKYLSFAISGLAILWGIDMADRRTGAMEEGNRQTVFRDAVTHLGSESVVTRVAGVYMLHGLVYREESMHPVIGETLLAHIRVVTQESEYQEKNKSRPSSDIQLLLDFLFRSKERVLFKTQRVNLLQACLRGANLMKARLQKADLIGAQLQGAQLQRIDLRKAQLQGADLRKAQLQGADLRGTQLQGANLSGAQLQGANLIEAQLQGAFSTEPFRIDLVPFEEQIHSRIGEESALSGVVFSGGLTQEEVDKIEGTDHLKSELQSHVGEDASYGLPEDSGAITGKYTQEDADNWIAEYRKAFGRIIQPILILFFKRLS